MSHDQPGPSSLPSFPAAGGWSATNADQMRPLQRRSFLASFISLTCWTALTFLAVFLLAWLLGVVFGAFVATVNDVSEADAGEVTDAEIAGFAATVAAVVFVAHLAAGTVLMMLLRIGETFAAWNPVVQGLLAWALAAPLAFVVLVLI